MYSLCVLIMLLTVVVEWLSGLLLTFLSVDVEILPPGRSKPVLHKNPYDAGEPLYFVVE